MSIYDLIAYQNTYFCDFKILDMDITSQKIPIYIITGFLGAGKTTFLNHFICSNIDKRVLVIENEVGKANIDGALIIQSALDVKELTAGCLCCDLNEKLYDLLYDLVQRRDEFDIIVIETTGIADPSSVADTIWTGGFMDKNYDLMSTICVADAKNLNTALQETEEARRQLAFANIVLLNKCEDMDDIAINDIKSMITKIHPGVEVMAGTEGVFDIASDKFLSQKGSLQSTNLPPINHKHQGINTFTLTFDRAFDYRQLRHTLMLLLNVNRHQIYRIKGILNVPDMDNKVILQSVFKTFRMEEGAAWLLTEKRESTIVFIGHEVEKASIERVFNQCLVKD